MMRRIKPLTTPTQHNVHLGCYVLDYLAHSFPTQLFEEYTDDEGNLLSRPVFRGASGPAILKALLERHPVRRIVERAAA
jgi:hypothetical protein